MKITDAFAGCEERGILPGADDCLGRGVDPEPLEYGALRVAYGLGGEFEFVGDLFVHETSTHEREDLDLPRREPGACLS